MPGLSASLGDREENGKAGDGGAAYIVILRSPRVAETPEALTVVQKRGPRTGRGRALPCAVAGGLGPGPRFLLRGLHRAALRSSRGKSLSEPPKSSKQARSSFPALHPQRKQRDRMAGSEGNYRRACALGREAGGSLGPGSLRWRVVSRGRRVGLTANRAPSLLPQW